MSSSDDEVPELVEVPREKKRLSRKKRRAAARKKEKRKQQRRDADAKKELAKWQKASSKVLDSFYLRLFLKNPEESALSIDEKIEKMRHESNFCDALSKKQCEWLREPFRAALLVGSGSLLKKKETPNHSKNHKFFDF